MGLLVTVGSKSVSSFQWNSEEAAASIDHQDQPPLPVDHIATVVSDEWQAIVSVSYHPHSDMAHVRTQIGLATQPLSSSEAVVHHVPLPLSAAESNQSYQLHVVFSQDHRHLACCIPNYDATAVVLVVWTLKRSSSASPKQPPRPSYVETTTATAQLNLLATNPVIETSLNNNISCLCPAVTHNQSILWVVCRDGRLVAHNYRHTIASFDTHVLVPHDIVQLSCQHDRMAAILSDHSVAIYQVQVLTTATPDVMASASPQAYFHVERLYTWKGPFLYGTWITNSLLALMTSAESSSSSSSSTGMAVQVWRVLSDTSHPLRFRWDLTAERLHESAHATFETGDLPEDDLRDVSATVRTKDPVKLRYDGVSDCILISGTVREKDGSSFLHHAFVCVWSWRADVEGMLLRGSLPSRTVTSELCIGNGFGSGRKLLHMIRHGRHRIHKEIYDVAILSPSHCTAANCARIEEANNLLLGSRSVSYPLVKKVSCDGEYEVEWQEARLPVDYVHEHGAPVLAATGRRMARSLSVAAPHGLCVLDNVGPQADVAVVKRPPRWRRFTGEVDEGQVRVLAMAWWEGYSSNLGFLSDDILVALVQVEGMIYLSGWSQRRVDVEHQLLYTVDDDSKLSWGVNIPHSWCPSRLDALEMPVVVDVAPEERKALVLLSDDSSEGHFQIFQLQVQSGSNSAHRYFRVSCRRAATGTAGSVAKMFLASGSFAFQLGETGIARADDYVATLGVMRPSSSGLDALAVSSTSVLAVGEMLLSSDNLTYPELSRFSLVGFCSNYHRTSPDGTTFEFIWIFRLDSGSLVRWAVPCPFSVDSASDLLQPMAQQELGSVHVSCEVLGRTCSAGKASMWNQQGGLGPKNAFPLSTVPGSSNSCVMASGQTCTHLHRVVGDDFEEHLFRKDLLNHEIWGPSDFTLLVPPLVTLLYSDLIEEGLDHSNSKPKGEHLQLQVDRLFRTSLHRDNAAMALQLLVLRLVETVAQSRLTSSLERLRTHRALFANMVHVLRLEMTSLQFATLMLEVGRQVEPSCFRHLFPLPASNIEDHESVRDLFDRALEQGSVTSASACLPMMLEDAAIPRCRHIYRHCLHVLEISLSQVSDDFREAERAILPDIFRYSMKIEDSAYGVLDEAGSTDTLRGDDDDSVGDATAKQKYSLFCGLSRFFGKRQREEKQVADAANTFIDGWFEGHAIPSDASGMNGHSGVATPWLRTRSLQHEDIGNVTANFLVGIVFHDDDARESQHASRWRLAAAVAQSLLGDSSEGLSTCSKGRFSSLLWELEGTNDSLSLDRSNGKRLDLVSLFSKSIAKCTRELDEPRASILLDLTLVVLQRHFLAEKLERNLLALIVIAIVTAHTSGRLIEIVASTGLEGNRIVGAYLEASFQQSSTAE